MSVSVERVYTKDPDAVLVYQVNWDAWLAPEAEIASSEWIIAGPDAVLTKDNASATTRVAQVRLSGGTLRRRYVVTNRIVTNEAPTQTEDRSFMVVIHNR